MKITPSVAVDRSRFEKPDGELEVLYGLPRHVQFCKKCNMSNQQPMSSNEYAHNKDSKKTTMSFDENGVCHACNFNELKETGRLTGTSVSRNCKNCADSIVKPMGATIASLGEVVARTAPCSHIC